MSVSLPQANKLINYSGLATHPESLNATESALQSLSFGIALARYIYGAKDTHRQLKRP